MKCLHCNAEIEQVSIGGVPAWAHVSPRTSLFPASLCSGGKRATPKECDDLASPADA